MSLNLKNQCRTCLKTDIKLQKLTDMIDSKAETTYKEALKALANFLFKDEYEDEMPQRICDGCCRKLRSAQNFITQAEEAANKLIQIVKDVQNASSIKQLDCLNENPIELSSTVEQCLQIKMEVENFENAAKDLEQVDNLIDNISIKNEQQFEAENQLLKNANKDDSEINYQSSTESIAQNGSKGDSSSESSVDEFEDEDKSETKNDRKTKFTRQRKLKKMNKYQLEEDDLLPVRCDECGKVLENSILLARHKRSTHLPDELKIPCPNCGRRFSRRCNMYAHMRTFHGQESVEILLKNSNAIQYRYKCDKCSCKTLYNRGN
uniref:C2H2-type domain-containing protein n=1 Tax=Glossina brevipalpis TaxID=37001 RepID=A0A1A9WTT5_9MUSC